MIPQDVYWRIEETHGHIIQTILHKYPQILGNPRFEFHAAPMWNMKGLWAGLAETDRDRIFGICVGALHYIANPCIVYGHVDISNYPKNNQGRHDGIVAAFGNCFLGVSSVLSEAEFPGGDPEGIILADEPDDWTLRDRIRQSFHALRPKVMASPMLWTPLHYVADDVYFGDSRNSVGLQMADIYSWLIMRQLSGSAQGDSVFFEQLKPFILDAYPKPQVVAQ